MCDPYTNLDKSIWSSTGDGGRRYPAASQAWRPRHNSRVHPIAAAAAKGKHPANQTNPTSYTNKTKPTGVREETGTCPGQSAESSRAFDGEHQTGAPPATLAQPHQTLQPGALRHRWVPWRQKRLFSLFFLSISLETFSLCWLTVLFVRHSRFNVACFFPGKRKVILDTAHTRGDFYFDSRPRRRNYDGTQIVCRKIMLRFNELVETKFHLVSSFNNYLNICWQLFSTMLKFIMQYKLGQCKCFKIGYKFFYHNLNWWVLIY